MPPATLTAPALAAAPLDTAGLALLVIPAGQRPFAATVACVMRDARAEGAEAIVLAWKALTRLAFGVELACEVLEQSPYAIAVIDRRAIADEMRAWHTEHDTVGLPAPPHALDLPTEVLRWAACPISTLETPIAA